MNILAKSDFSPEVLGEESNNVLSDACSNLPPTIIQILASNEISNEEMKLKKDEIDTFDSFTFFCWSQENPYDNGWKHIWYVNNYSSLLNEQALGNQDAHYIVEKIQEFVRTELWLLAQWEEKLKLIAIKEDIWKSFDGYDWYFKHGFTFDTTEYKWIQYWATKFYKDEW